MKTGFTVLLATLLLGCGSESGVSSPTTIDEPEPLTVVANEYQFLPATLSTAEPTLVQLDNSGALAHTWTVLSQPIRAEAELTSDLVLAEVRVEPGQSATVDLEGLEPGNYQVICAIPGHVSAGMIGELIID